MTSAMMKVSTTEAIECISLLPIDVASMIWGPPGTGKTDTLEQFFEKLGYRVIHVLAGQSEPADIGGIPFNFKDLYAKYIVPWWGFLASEHPEVPEEWQGPIALFLDDIVTAHEQTQAALYKVVDEKRIGDLIIRENVRIVAAGNSVDDMSAVTDMPKALCNRFMHFYVEPRVDPWMDWATKNGIHPHVIFFLRQNPSKLSEFEDAKNSGDHAWATPRTWEMLSKSLFALEEAGLRDSEHEHLVVQGCIGALATMFIAHIRDKYKIVTVEEIIGDPEGAEVPSEPDRMYATVTNLEHWYNKPENHKFYEEFATYALRCKKDFGIILLRHMTHIVLRDNADESLVSEITSSDVFAEVTRVCGENLINTF